MPAPAPEKTVRDIARLHLLKTGQMTTASAGPGRRLIPTSELDVLKERSEFLLKTVEDLVRKYDAVEARIKELEK